MGGEALAAVAELRRLVLHQRFQEAERLLATLQGLGSATTIAMLRQLCVSGAEQLRIASELDSAARAQRLLAQEVRHGIEALLASWERHIRAAGEETAPSVSVGLRDESRRRRRWRILGSGYGASGTEARAGPATAEPATPPVAVLEPMPAQQVARPEAEVAASALGPLDLTVGHDGQLYIADGTFFYVTLPDGSLRTVGMLFSPGYPGFLRGVASSEPGEFVVTTSGGQVSRYRPAANESA